MPGFANYSKLRAQLLIGLLLLCASVKSQSFEEKWQLLDAENSNIIKLSYENLDSAIILSESLIRKILKPYNKVIYSRILLNKGHLHFDKGEFDEANSYYLKALEFREDGSDLQSIANVQMALANLNYFTQSYFKSRDYALKSISNNTQGKAEAKEIAKGYNLLGLTYYDQNIEDSAIYFYNKGIALLDEHPGSVGLDYLQLYDNKGAALVWLEKYEEGIFLLKKNITVLQENNNVPNLAWKYNQLTRAYLDWDKLDSAKTYLRESHNLIVRGVPKETGKEIVYSDLLWLIESKGSTSEIVSRLNEYSELSNKLLTEKSKQNIQDAQTKYETEKKEAALKLSEEEKAKLKAENKAKNRLMLLGLSIFAIVLLLGLYFYRNFKQKEKLNELELEIKDSKLDELLYNQESRSLSYMLQGQEKERERIAQDLHDRLGGTLAALKLSLRKPQYQIEEDDLSIIDIAVNEVRGIAHNLSTGLVHKYGLNEAVNQLFRTIEQSKGIRFTVFLHQDIGKLGQSAGIELYRIVQELLSNTLKHANATEVSLQTNFVEDTFNMVYEDNGVGFDGKELKGGIGLENVRNRVKKLNGELHIDAEKGRGSIFIVELKTK